MRIYDENKGKITVNEGDVIIDNEDTYFIVMREVVCSDETATGFTLGPWRLVNLSYNRIARPAADSLEELLSTFGESRIKEVIPAYKVALKIER